MKIPELDVEVTAKKFLCISQRLNTM